jgi:hypothetical protein
MDAIGRRRQHTQRDYKYHYGLFPVLINNASPVAGLYSYNEK